MGRRFLTSTLTIAAVGGLVALAAAPVRAQAAKPKTPTQTWSPPRTPDGQPDVQGFFKVQLHPYMSVTLERLDKPFGDLGVQRPPDLRGAPDQDSAGGVVDPADGKIPYLPWARAKREDLLSKQVSPTPEYLDPVSHCLPPGIPRSFFVNRSAFQILQPPGYVVFLYEYENISRIVPLDGRPRVGSDIKQWMGDSRGHWEGNTLVVDAANFNDKSWLDLTGDFHSDAMRIVERWTFGGADTITFEATFEDSKVFARPWKLAAEFNRVTEPGFELLEFACWEGERNAKSMLESRSKGKQ